MIPLALSKNAICLENRTAWKCEYDQFYNLLLPYLKLLSFKTFFNKPTRKGKNTICCQKLVTSVAYLKSLSVSLCVSLRVSKSVKYCLNHKGFHPIILLSKVGCFLLPSVYVAFSDILMPEELPQIHSMSLVVEFEGAEVIKWRFLYIFCAF